MASANTEGEREEAGREDVLLVIKDWGEGGGEMSLVIFEAKALKGERRVDSKGEGAKAEVETPSTLLFVVAGRLEAKKDFVLKGEVIYEAVIIVVMSVVTIIRKHTPKTTILDVF